MRNRTSKLDMTHPIATDRTLRDLNPATVANNPLIANPFVFSAVALIILLRSENTLAEKTVLFRPLRAVIDGFGLGYFAVGPSQNVVGRRQFDPY